MGLRTITDLAGLHRHLAAAVQLEHATIPPYLTALYSIEPGSNSEAAHIIRAVVVEEMLHLTLAANLLNAVGGDPDLSGAGFVPTYPAYLPDGETDFRVDLRRFSPEAIETFLKIERPATPDSDADHTVRRPPTPGAVRAARVDDADGGSDEHFYSIGEFYRAIGDGLDLLHEQHGDALFSGDDSRQVTADAYYSGGGEVIPVTDRASAHAAIRLISEQGEGDGGAIYDYEDEISHYYRFQQLVLGRYYRQGDSPGDPSGGPVDVDWDAVLPVATNARVADLPEGSELRAAAVGFNATYAGLLRMLTRALQGEPALLTEAVGAMFRTKDLALQLMRHPLSDGLHAAPTFEMPVPAQAGRS